MLILETPNPENLVVGSSNFYLDPTHKRPIPPPLLSFMAEYAGFQRVKVLRLQENPGLLSDPSLGLLSVLNGVSPDYAIVAQKDGPPELMQALDEVFAQSFGIGLSELAAKYDQDIKQDIASMRTAVHQLTAQATLKEREIQDMNEQLSEAQRRAHEQEQRASQAEAKAHEWWQSATQYESRLAEAERRAHDHELRAVVAEARLDELQQQRIEIKADRERWLQRAE